MQKYSKFIVAAVGAALSFIVAVYGNQSTAYNVAQAVVGILTIFGVYQVSNKESAP